MTERSIVIVGGGFAAWLAALALGRLPSGSTGTRWRVCVLEAPSIAPVGVGESATGLLAEFLARHDIPASTFVRDARATLKLGLELSGWSGPDSHYFSPIDNPDHMAGIAGTTSISQRCAIADGERLECAHLHAWLMRHGKVPAIAANGTLELLGTHSWHFDAAAAARCVQAAALRRGVENAQGIVASIDHQEDGTVRALTLADGRTMGGDFFLDCTGQHRLFKDALGCDWKPQSGVIPVNRAVAGWVPHRRGVPAATRAIAAPAGWIWEIPTGDRLGVGYVHDDGAIGLDDAWEALGAHSGEGFAAGPTLRFEAGFRREPWRFNTVAIGMAAGFCEPLQSTSLHLALMQISWIVQLLADGADRASFASESRRYNQFMSACQKDMAEFVALHYARPAFPNRFWASAGAAARSTDLFRSCFGHVGFPNDASLRGRSGAISANLVLPVADGLGLLDAASAAATVSATQRAAAASARQLHRRYCAQALRHEAALRLLAGAPQSLEALAARAAG